MHKKKLLQGLQKFASQYEERVQKREISGFKGQKTFALFLARYLDNLEIPSDEKYDFWDIKPYLPELLVAAFESLRTNDEEWVVEYRNKYEQDTGHEVPNITDIGEGSIFARQSAIQTTLGFMMRDVMGERGGWIENQIDKYCNAQDHVLKQTMDKFLRRVWWQGMYKMVAKNSSGGMSGKFGETDLRTFRSGGRIMFTFARRHKGKTGIYFGGKLVETLPYEEDSVSFVADDSDPLALGTGLQSLETTFRTALDMIEDVISNWPDSQKKREKIYATSKDVSLI